MYKTKPKFHFSSQWYFLSCRCVIISLVMICFILLVDLLVLFFFSCVGAIVCIIVWCYNPHIGVALLALFYCYSSSHCVDVLCILVFNSSYIDSCYVVFLALLHYFLFLRCYIAFPHVATLLFSHCCIIFSFCVALLFFSCWCATLLALSWCSSHTTLIALPMLLHYFFMLLFLLCWCYRSCHNSSGTYWPNFCSSSSYVDDAFVPLVTMVLPPILALCMLELRIPSISGWCYSSLDTYWPIFGCCSFHSGVVIVSLVYVVLPLLFLPCVSWRFNIKLLPYCLV